MEEPPSRSSATSKRTPAATLSPLAVEPGAKVPDYSRFNKVLVLYSDKDEKKGIWFPIDFISGDLIPKTLKVVSSEQLKDVKYPKDLMTKDILISDSPLNRAEILSLPGEVDNFYEKMELRLMTQEKLNQLTKKVADKALLEIHVRILQSKQDYAKVGTQSRPDGQVWNEAYDREIQLDDLEEKINTRLANEFRTLQYQLYTPLDLHESKFTSFANIVNILARVYRTEIRSTEKEFQKAVPVLRKEYQETVPQVKQYLETTSQTVALNSDRIYRVRRLSDFLKFDNLSDQEFIRVLNDFNPNNFPGDIQKFSLFLEVKKAAKIEKKLRRLQLKFSWPQSNHPKLLRPSDVSTAGRVTFWNLLIFGLRSPDLCGMLKYLNLIEDSTILENTFKNYFHPGLESIQEATKLLAREETRQILKTSTEIDGNEAFVLSADNPVVWGTFPISTLQQLDNRELPSMRKASAKPSAKKLPGVIPVAESEQQKVEKLVQALFQLIESYTFNMFKDLDLSETVITGSIIPATLGLMIRQTTNYTFAPQSNAKAGIPLPAARVNSVNLKWTSEKLEELEYQMQRYYPVLYTQAKDLEKYRQLISQGRYRVSSHKVSDLSGKQQVRIDYVDGADIDLAVLTEDNDEFDLIARRHFQKFKEAYPDITLKKVEKVKKYLWEIDGLPRKVQIYQSSLRQILSHHLGMVRGFIFGNGPDRMLYCSANCLLALRNLKSPNYYYFAGIKSPAEIILKYEQRGYLVKLPGHIRSLIGLYSRLEPRWQNKIDSVSREVKKLDGLISENTKAYGAVQLLLNQISQKLELLYTTSRNFSALLGWGNFDIAFIQEEEKDFAKRAGLDYREFNFEFYQARILEALEKKGFSINEAGQIIESTELPEEVPEEEAEAYPEDEDDEDDG